MSRRMASVVSAGAVVSIASIGVAAFVRAGAGAIAVAAAVALALSGAALVSWAHAVRTTDSEVAPRSHEGPELSRRHMFLRFGLGTAALTAAGVSIPAARRIERAVHELERTSWQVGRLVVDSQGEPVRIERIGDGGIMTVYPEGAVGSADSQAVLIREPIDRFAAGRELVVDGVVIHSKLCTHMACSLGLYQQDSGTLLCPCHQAAFDVLDGGRPVSGPARRPLPRLPFRRRSDGLLVATGDFDGVVGAGFWWRP